MTRDQAFQAIAAIVTRIAEDKGTHPDPITGDTIILGGDLPIDSLDVAALLVEMQRSAGHDPFKDGFILFRTVDDLAALYGD